MDTYLLQVVCTKYRLTSPAPFFSFLSSFFYPRHGHGPCVPVLLSRP